MSRRLLMLTVVSAMLLSACGTPKLAASGFPAAPVDVTKPLGELQQLPAKPSLSDELNADLANMGKALEWRSIAQAWSDWYKAQAQNASR